MDNVTECRYRHQIQRKRRRTDYCCQNSSDEPVKKHEIDEKITESLRSTLFSGCFDVFSVLLFDAINKNFPDESIEIRIAILQDMLSEIIEGDISSSPLQTNEKPNKSLFENLKNMEGN